LAVFFKNKIGGLHPEYTHYIYWYMTGFLVYSIILMFERVGLLL